MKLAILCLLCSLSACGRIGFDPLGGDIGRLALGGTHTCLLVDDGLRCWGSNDHGQLGYGHVENIGDDEPAAAGGIVPLGGVPVRVAAGGGAIANDHTCAVLDTGGVRCWGFGELGRLGYGSTGDLGDDEVPSVVGDVPLGGRAIDVALGERHTCAVLESGAVRCWGHANQGQLGYGSTATIGDDEPASAGGDVPLGGRAVAIAAGSEHSCALLDSHAVRCWGRGTEGQLGYGSTNNVGDDESPSAVGDVPLGGRAVQVAAEFQTTCALLDSGAVRCWGAAMYGQLGHGSTANIGDDEPVLAAGDIPLGEAAVQIAVGGSHVCAVLARGAVRCWGRGAEGRLGYGNQANLGDDEPASAAGDVPLGGIAVEIDAGTGHTCARLDSGTTRCWGDSNYGQLGYGNLLDIGDDEPASAVGDVPL